MAPTPTTIRREPAHEFYASCPEGFEVALADELRAIGARHVRRLKGRVSFSGETADAYRACLWSRLASRVFVTVARFDCISADDLLPRAAYSLLGGHPARRGNDRRLRPWHHRRAPQLALLRAAGKRRPVRPSDRGRRPAARCRCGRPRRPHPPLPARRARQPQPRPHGRPPVQAPPPRGRSPARCPRPAPRLRRARPRKSTGRALAQMPSSTPVKPMRRKAPLSPSLSTPAAQAAASRSRRRASSRTRRPASTARTGASQPGRNMTRSCGRSSAPRRSPVPRLLAHAPGASSPPTSRATPLPARGASSRPPAFPTA